MLCLVTRLLEHIGLCTRGWGCSQSDLCSISANLSMRVNQSVRPRRGYFLNNVKRPGGMLVLRVGFCIYPLAWLNYIMGCSSHISAVILLFCSSPACLNLSFDRTRICNFRLQKRRCHRKDTLCESGDEPLSGRVFLSLLGSIPVVQESQVNILVLLIYPFDNFYSCFCLAISLRPIRGRGGHMFKTIFIHKLALVFIADKLRTIVCY